MSLFRGMMIINDFKLHLNLPQDSCCHLPNTVIFPFCPVIGTCNNGQKTPRNINSRTNYTEGQKVFNKWENPEAEEIHSVHVNTTTLIINEKKPCCYQIHNWLNLKIRYKIFWEATVVDKDINKFKYIIQIGLKEATFEISYEIWECLCIPF
jgi:hypothetical protein